MCGGRPSKRSPQPMQRAAHPFEAGLLPQLPHDGLDQGLAVLDPAAGHLQRPWPAPAAPHEQQPVVVDHHGADAQTTGAHVSERCTTMARATRPKDSKKFLVWRSPGRARLSTPKHPCSPAPVDQRLHHRLTDAELSAAGLRVEVGDHAEPPPSASTLGAGDAVAHDHVVDGADQHVVVRVAELGARARARTGARRAAARAHTSPPRPARSSATAASASSASRGRSASVARAAGLLRGAAISAPWSCATFDRIVLRPRWAAS